MNSVQILGNLARDPEVRYTKTGRAVATFTVAATNTYIDSTTNETKEQTAFINCVAWGKLGEAAGNLRKGSRCFVEGRLQTRSYETQDGQKPIQRKIKRNTCKKFLVNCRSSNRLMIKQNMIRDISKKQEVSILLLESIFRR